MPNTPQPSSFPKTKLFPPLVHDDILMRPYLLARLHQAVTTKRLTLVSAQAGAGKTTAVAALHHTHPELPLAWLSLDDDDNQPVQFATVLLASLHNLLPDCELSATSVLQGAAENSDVVKLVLRALINDLLDHEPESFVLVLDDLHIIENQAIHRGLDYLLEHLPPMMHLVVTTRQDPPLALSKLRVRNHLAEIRVDDLRFAQEEMASLLNDSFDFALTPADLARIEERTEGWVAGVRLLTLSLASIPVDQRSAFIDRFAQSHTFIFDYLVDEVLNQQEPLVIQFLLETSILRELTPSLCNAVTGRSDCAQLLGQIHRRNLFLTRRDFNPQLSSQDQASFEPTYRYHDLFAQFLRQQLHQSVGKEQIQDLHRSAAEANIDLNRVIHHYVAGQWWNKAAETIEAEGKRQLEGAYVHQDIEYWCKPLPDSLLNERPWLLLLRGFRALDTGQRNESDLLFEQARRLFEETDDTLGEAMTLYGLNRYRGHHELPSRERLIELGTTHANHPFFVVNQVSNEIGSAWIAMHTQQWHLVHGHVRAGLKLALKQGSIAAIRSAIRNLGIQFFFGELALSEARAFIDIVDQRYAGQDMIVDMCLPLHKANIAFYAGNLDEAEKQAIEASQMLDRIGGDIVLYYGIDHVIYFSRFAKGDFVGIDDYLANIRSRFEGIESYKDSTVYLGMRTRIAWTRNQVQTAKRFARSAENQTVPSSNVISKERSVSVQEILGLYKWAQGNLEEAEHHFKEAVTIQRETLHTTLCTDNRLNLAILFAEQGQTEDALEWLAPALNRWAKKEMPGVVLQSGQRIIPVLKLAIKHKVEADFSQQVLDIFGQAAETRPIAIPETNESLTPREVDVLRLIVRGSSNQEIADELVVSLNTVKSHITRVLAKLNVTSRTQAAVKARSLGI